MERLRLRVGRIAFSGRILLQSVMELKLVALAFSFILFFKPTSAQDFVNVADQAGLGHLRARTVWPWQIDRDGDLDLYVSIINGTNIIYENNGIQMPSGVYYYNVDFMDRAYKGTNPENEVIGIGGIIMFRSLNNV